MQQFTGDAARSRDTARSTVDWVREAQQRGAGTRARFKHMFARPSRDGRRQQDRFNPGAKSAFRLAINHSAAEQVPLGCRHRTSPFAGVAQ